MADLPEQSLARKPLNSYSANRFSDFFAGYLAEQNDASPEQLEHLKAAAELVLEKLESGEQST